jgi:hypothetical protein
MLASKCVECCPEPFQMQAATPKSVRRSIAPPASYLNFKFLEHIEKGGFKHGLELWVFGFVSSVFLPHIF